MDADKSALPMRGMHEAFVAKHSDRSARRGACYAELSLDVRLAGHGLARGAALDEARPDDLADVHIEVSVTIRIEHCSRVYRGKGNDYWPSFSGHLSLVVTYVPR